mmetsp:Transcript_35826/g.65738  ORF Transcript_35826/g.65738 Transcript_35826/m.65738 type:complete len:90 (+) Transcript_35826:105-374(+)
MRLLEEPHTAITAGRRSLTSRRVHIGVAVEEARHIHLKKVKAHRRKKSGGDDEMAVHRHMDTIEQCDEKKAMDPALRTVVEAAGKQAEH